VGEMVDCGAIIGDLRGFWGFGLGLGWLFGGKGCFGLKMIA